VCEHWPVLEADGGTAARAWETPRWQWAFA